MIKHKNLSIFIPHEGCPQDCSFCDQRKISSKISSVKVEEVVSICEEFLPKENAENFEVAFFGGSFTAINKDYMIALLEAVQPFLKANRANGIRISTRPDAINKEILEILKKYNVTSIELGAQSMQDEVLFLNKRGHTIQDVYNASKLIKEYGFQLGLQMMTGLYGQKDYKECAKDTAEKFILIKPDTVRIYPTITLKDTLLEELVYSGQYKPPSLEESVDICSMVARMFLKEDIKIIKLGLHAQKEVEEGYVSGPYHPAFSELVFSKIYFDKINELVNEKEKNYKVYVHKNRLSQARGQKKENIQKFKNLGFNIEICPVDTEDYEYLKVVCDK